MENLNAYVLTFLQVFGLYFTLGTGKKKGGTYLCTFISFSNKFILFCSGEFRFAQFFFMSTFPVFLISCLIFDIHITIYISIEHTNHHACAYVDTQTGGHINVLYLNNFLRYAIKSRWRLSKRIIYTMDKLCINT